MNLNDFLPKTTVAEVAMNPTAYAQSVEQGQAEGVLVGFEFEVCVPAETIEEFIRAQAPTNRAPMTHERVQRIIRNNSSRIYRIDNRDEAFSRLFTPKNNSRYPSFLDAKKKLESDRIEKVKQLLPQIPAEKLGNYTRLARNKINTRIRTSLRNNGRSYSDAEKQLLIARDIAERYHDEVRYNRSNLEAVNTARNIFELAKIPDMDDILRAMWPRVRDTDNIINNINRYFDYDPQTVYDEYQLRAVDPNVPDHERSSRSGGFSGAANVLKPALEQTMGADVVVFTSYHQRTKNMTSWYIEPDGSLQPNPGDGAAECVGPPELPNKALDSLKKFFAMAAQLKLYTSSRNATGLHINVSIPKDLDILKLAVFLGDQHVLKQFNRENNSYARGVMKQLSQPGGRKVTSTVPVAEDLTNPTQTQIDLPKLQQIAKDISQNHFASISSNGKYISFRHAGGNYLGDYQAILNVVGRFVRAMVIAADPAAYRNEYLKAVTKLVGQREPAPRVADVSGYINEIKQDGLVVKTVYMYIRPEIKVDPTEEDFAQILSDEDQLVPNLNYTIQLNSAEAKSTLVTQSRPDGRARREMSGDETGAVGQFAVATVMPADHNDAVRMEHSQTRGVDLARTNRNIVGYRRNFISRIPATDPQAVRFMRQLQIRGRRI